VFFNTPRNDLLGLDARLRLVGVAAPVTILVVAGFADVVGGLVVLLLVAELSGTGRTLLAIRFIRV
jgi:hypothetical protein